MTKYSTFSSRLMAYNIDVTIFMLVMFPLSFLISSNEIFYVSCIVGIVFYHAVCESSSLQATIGKHYLKMKVENDSGEKMDLLTAIGRIALKFISLFFFFIGFLMIYFRKDKKGLHDVILKTRVIGK